MKLTGIPGTEDTPNWNAAAEQACIVYSLHRNSPDRVIEQLKVALGPQDLQEQLDGVNPDIKSVSSNSKSPTLFDGTDGVPVYLCFYHQSEYWLVIMGTYTAEQWIKNCLGVVVQKNFPDTTQKFHKYWLEMATTLLQRIKDDVGDLGNTPFNIVGHSLGAAVAYDLAILMKKESQFRPVRLLTFGSPRPCRGDYAGTRPSFHYDVQTKGDFIVQVPPNLPIDLAPYWKIQGNPSVVKEDGTLAAANSQTGEVDVTTIRLWEFPVHFPGYYAEVLARRAQSLGLTPVLNSLMAATGQVAGKKIAPDLFEPPPSAIPPFLGNPTRLPMPAPNQPVC